MLRLSRSQPSSSKCWRVKLIDAGADAIIGSHPHVTQTIDWYKDRSIVYSLGNFVFDYYPDDPPVFTGWIVRLTFGQTPRPTLDENTPWSWKRRACRIWSRQSRTFVIGWPN